MRFLITKLSLLTAILIMSANIGAAAQEAQKPDWQEALASRITVNGYAQAGFDWSDPNGISTNSFAMRRVIMWMQADITDRWYFRIMHNFSGSLLEYYTDFQLTSTPAVKFRFGQFKNSYTLENPMSPSAVELIDVCSQAVTLLAGGSDPLMGNNSGRDLGMMFFGDLLGDRIHYELALMNGQGINVKDGNNAKDLIVKIEGKPFKGLRLVASGQKGQGHAIGTAAWNPSVALGDNYTRDRYSVGAEFKTGTFAPSKYKEARPISVRGEWLEGRDGTVCSQGAYISTTVPVFKCLDLVASCDWLCRNTQDKGWNQTNGTIGIQYWFYKKCRIQAQYTRRVLGANLGPAFNSLQTQFQIAF